MSDTYPIPPKICTQLCDIAVAASEATNLAIEASYESADAVVSTFNAGFVKLTMTLCYKTYLDTYRVFVTDSSSI